jgi:hypothetical protein
MKCPRCSSWLREVEPGPIWLRHFCCDECWRAWHIEIVSWIASDETNPKIRFRKTEYPLYMGRKTRADRLAA